MSYSALRNTKGDSLGEALSMSTALPAGRNVNKRNMSPDDVRIEDDFAKLFSTDQELIGLKAEVPVYVHTYDTRNDAIKAATDIYR